MITAYVGLGSNLGDRMANLSAAVEAISDIPETHIETVSNAYESDPAYRQGQPQFLNAVLELTTRIEADALLAYLLDIEDRMGRVREEENGPRVIDLDLLLYGDEEWHSEALTLPHPGMLERDFVVTPLLSIAPRVTLPDGMHVRPSAAVLGTVTSDRGPIPDSGVAENEPVDADDWVAVAVSETTADRVVGFDAALQLKSEVLEQEGIAFAWDPHEPGADIDPFGLAVAYRLLVPAEDADRARRVLDEFDASEPPPFTEIPAM